MNKSQLYTNFWSIMDYIIRYEKLIKKIISNESKFIKTEQIIMIELMATRLISVWDSFIEDLLIDCFNKDTSKYSQESWYKIPKHLTRDTCASILNWIGFFDIKSYSDLNENPRKY